MSTTATVTTIPNCDLCKDKGVVSPAYVDGRTVWGPWAYMCRLCFAIYGTGLGTGSGQVLEVERKEG